MKKSIFICIILLFLIVLFQSISSANDNDKIWNKLNKYVYIDKNSIIKNNDRVSAWFKIYNSPKNNSYKIINTDAHYQINKYEVECKTPVTISIEHSKSYDKNNNLINEYINKQGYACLYPCLVNDNIIIKEL